MKKWRRHFVLASDLVVERVNDSCHSWILSSSLQRCLPVSPWCLSFTTFSFFIISEWCAPLSLSSFKEFQRHFSRSVSQLGHLSAVINVNLLSDSFISKLQFHYKTATSRFNAMLPQTLMFLKSWYPGLSLSIFYRCTPDSSVNPRC